VAGLSSRNACVSVTDSAGVPNYTSGATANRLLRTDGTTVSFAQVNLATDVTGTLSAGSLSGTIPVTSGGTGLASTQANKILYSRSANPLVGETSRKP